ncbi:MAG: hypothetical protein ACFE8A_00365 [Candidatus Hodarchaeota archaeon]
MEKDNESRKCPYCGVTLQRPYWVHIQSKHPAEYAKNETWIQLYKDYTSMGMDQSMSLMVISELFNQSIKDVKSYLKENGIL